METLSNKITGKDIIFKEDVREFIRKLKAKWPDADAVHKDIDELAGKELIDG